MQICDDKVGKSQKYDGPPNTHKYFLKHQQGISTKEVVVLCL